MVDIMFGFLKRLFCKHNYGYKGVWKCTFRFMAKDKESPVPIHFFECRKCGKRKIIKESDCLYNNNILNLAKLWLKGEIDVDFSDDDRVQVKRYDEDY
jgi:hypothetical protein